jgi:hypothetical protein
MIPLLLARIRIPIPAELVGPLMVVGAIMMLFILFVLMQGKWGAAGHLGQVGLVLIVASVLHSLTAGMPFYAQMLGWRVALDAVLLGAAFFAWKFRGKRLDLAAAAIAAAAYALLAPLLTALFMGSRSFQVSRILNSGLWALCLLGGAVLLAGRLKPGWAGVLAGAAAGALVGDLVPFLMAGVAPTMPRNLLASVVHGLGLGLALALALGHLRLGKS